MGNTYVQIYTYGFLLPLAELKHRFINMPLAELCVRENATALIFPIT